MENNKLKYVKTYKDLKKSKLLRDNLQEGDYICVEDENKIYQYKNKMFAQIDTKSNNNINISLYDLNKQIIGQLNDVPQEEVINNINEYYNKHLEVQYFLLLCHEKKYITVFHKAEKAQDNFVQTIIDCLPTGQIKTVELDDEKMEIWIKGEDEDTADYILFPYDMGVVDFE